MAVAGKILDPKVSGDMRVLYITDIENTGLDNLMEGPCTVYMIAVENGAAEVFLKLYDSIEPNYGTTEPEFVMQIDASITALFPMQLPDGVSFTTGLSIAAAVEAGGDCTTVPAQTANVTIYLKPA